MEEIEIPITFLQLSRFTGDRVRMPNEGEAVLKAKHLVSVGVKRVGLEEVVVQAACLQSSKIRDAPHDITITFFYSVDVMWKCFCSCKAGAGAHCKHVFAVLLHCLQ